jgi:hypothetical protein
MRSSSTSAIREGVGVGGRANNQQRGSGRGPAGPKVGSILTGTVVGQVRKGVTVQVGGAELLLPRSRWGAAVDRLEGAMFGDPVTVEVVAGGGGDGPSGLSRVAIERTVRQPRAIDGRMRVAGAVCTLEPVDGSTPFAVHLLDVADASRFHDRTGTWFVGAPLLGVRFVTLEGDDRRIA